jgi:hypothetical protein
MSNSWANQTSGWCCIAEMFSSIHITTTSFLAIGTFPLISPLAKKAGTSILVIGFDTIHLLSLMAIIFH